MSSQEKMKYDKTFFEHNFNLYSPQKILPIIFEAINPKSIIDVGCGEGSWLMTASNMGIGDFIGVDDSYIDKSFLKFDHNLFIPHDLTKPLKLDRKFDMAMSFEVGEHLNKNSAETFVKSLVSLADVVVFSAAIPHQGMTGIYHLNEQWQAYWIELFKNEGYVAVDYIRPLISSDKNIKWWYRQNILVFVKEEKLDTYPVLSNKAKMDEMREPISYALPEYCEKFFAVEEKKIYRKMYWWEKLLINFIPIKSWRKILRLFYEPL